MTVARNHFAGPLDATQRCVILMQARCARQRKYRCMPSAPRQCRMTFRYRTAAHQVNMTDRPDSPRVPASGPVSPRDLRWLVPGPALAAPAAPAPRSFFRHRRDIFFLKKRAPPMPVKPAVRRAVPAAKGAVVTKAALRAAARLGLSNKTLAAIIGVSEATVSRM